VLLDEVESGMVTRFHGLADAESACHQRLPAIEHHRVVVGRSPWVVTGDRWSPITGMEAIARCLGVRHMVVPRTGQRSVAQRARERERSWRRRYRWRAGIEGCMYRRRRDDGLARSRSHGLVGPERDVGWGVLASDLRHLAIAQAQRWKVSANCGRSTDQH
jgi:IS5 family transposase